jgi:hypothetical protein
VEAIHAFQVTFPDSETHLVKLAQDSVNKLVFISSKKVGIYIHVHFNHVTLMFHCMKNKFLTAFQELSNFRGVCKDTNLCTRST